MADNTQTDRIESILLPMQGRPWLLPAVAVAEVMPIRQPDRPGRGVDWLLGGIGWRDRDIPLISFERLNDSGQVSIGLNAKIAIIATRDEENPFFAMIVQGEARQIAITEENLTDEPTQTGPAEARCVQVDEEMAVIPDLGLIEEAIGSLPKL